jgi:anti-sigma-K factor RskA
MTIDHDALRDLAAGYAFGTLDASEREAFESHLPSCPECQQDVRDAALVAQGLARAPQDHALPPGLRDRVLRAATADPDREARAVIPAPARRLFVPAWVSLAASIVALVAAGLAWHAHREAESARVDAARQQEATAAAERTLTEMRTTVDESQHALAIAMAGDVTRVALAGQPAAPQAAGAVLWSASRGLLFSASNLPALPAGRIYQLWYVTSAAPVSAALAAPDAAGGIQAVSGPVDVRPTAFALTIEPAGGVPAPTGAFYLLGAL